MRRALLSCLLLWPLAGFADVSSRSLPCDIVTPAPGCLVAAEIAGIVPSGGLAALDDRIRLAGVARDLGNRPVLVDLSLADGAVLSVTPLARDLPPGTLTELSPDGAVLLAILPGVWPADLATDSQPPQNLVVFDASGAQIGAAEGLAVAALVDAFGENRIRFGPGVVALDLGLADGDGTVTVEYGPGLETGESDGAGVIPDGEWLFENLFDRDRGWTGATGRVLVPYARDGSPAHVSWTDRSGAARVILGSDDPATPFAYEREFTNPVLSVDESHLAVTQHSDPAPGPILHVLALPEGRVLWRAALGEIRQGEYARQAVYRWTADGRLVVLQPHRTFSDVRLFMLFAPGP